MRKTFTLSTLVLLLAIGWTTSRSLVSNAASESDQAEVSAPRAFAVSPGNGSCAVFAFQPSCDDNVPQADGYLQISAADQGTHYGWSVGGTYTGPTTPAGATPFDPNTDLPLQFAQGQPNPTGSQDYTVRIFRNNDANDFADVVVTMQEQDCTLGCDCKDQVYLNDFRFSNDNNPSNDFNMVHKFTINNNGSLTEIGSPFIEDGDAPFRPHGLMTDNNGNIYIGQANSFGAGEIDGPIFKFSALGETLSTDFIPSTVTDGYSYNILSKDGIGYFADVRRGVVDAYDLCDGSLIGSMLIDTDGDQLTGVTGTNVWGLYLGDTNWYLPERMTGYVFTGPLDVSL